MPEPETLRSSLAWKTHGSLPRHLPRELRSPGHGAGVRWGWGEWVTAGSRVHCVMLPPVALNAQLLPQVSGLGEGQARGLKRRTYFLWWVEMKPEALGQKWRPLGPIDCPVDRAGQPSSGSKGSEWHLGGPWISCYHIASLYFSCPP